MHFVVSNNPLYKSDARAIEESTNFNSAQDKTIATDNKFDLVIWLGDLLVDTDRDERGGEEQRSSFNDTYICLSLLEMPLIFKR